MKILFLECNMGIAGDMLMSALFELFDDKNKIIAEINRIGLPDTVISFNSRETCGINGTKADVVVNGVTEGDSHIACTHRKLSDVKTVINSLNLSHRVKEKATYVFNILADAESLVHNTTPENIHFHEVGTLDAIADAVVCSFLIDKLSIDKIIVSPVNTGSGTVKCAHGVLPVPAPATAEILKGVPAYSNGINGELCTPTGAALVKCFADEFSSMPVMSTEKIGYGIGSKEFETANCVRAFLGEDDNNSENTVELACNIDDTTAEELSFACDVLMKNGALDVCQCPAVMKKSRLGTVLSVLCSENDKQKILELIFKHTSTIGVREYKINRFTLERHIERISTPMGDADVKISEGYGVKKKKVEFEHLKKLAEDNGLSVSEVKNLLLK